MTDPSSLPFYFEQPFLLFLLIPCLALTWWFGRNSLAGLSKARGRFSLALRMLLIAVLVITLSRPKWKDFSDAVAVYFVVDLSNSIPQEKLCETNDQIASAAGAKPENDLAGIVYFGADSSCEQPPSKHPLSLQRSGVVDKSGTDIAGAIRLAASTFPADSRKRIVLVTDGNQNCGDAILETENLRSQGIQLDVLPIEYSFKSEMMISGMDVPSKIETGSTFAVRVTIQSTKAATAILSIKSGGVKLNRSEVVLQKGRNYFSIPITLDKNEKQSGIKTFEADIAPVNPADDQLYSNNNALALTRISGPPRVLYIDGNIGLSEGYRPILHRTLLKKLNLVDSGSEGEKTEITLTLCDTNTIPGASELIAYDCIIIDNLAAENLGADQMERIRTLVNAQGSGLVMIGGERSFGVGNYRNTPIEEALPVEMDLKNKKVMPNGALILVIDRSGSMEGEKLGQAKAAAWAAAEVLSGSDYLGIIAFDSVPNWVLKPTLAQNRGLIRKKVLSLGSGGGTDIMLALQEAIKALTPLNATLKHIVMLSDGQSNPAGLDALTAMATKEKITISAVGIGEKDGQSLMSEIARRGNGRFYFVNDPTKLPRIFIKESMFIKRALIFEESFTPVIADRNDEFLQDIDQNAIPQIHGYVATTAKTAATVPIVSANENRDPILAHWRYGLGRSVAFTSDAKNRWGKDWLAWDGYDDFWEGVVYRILRQKPANLQLVSRIDGKRGKIVAHALDDDGNPMPFMKMVASVTDPQSGIKRIPLRQTGISRYEAEFDAVKPGNYEISVIGKGEGDQICAAYGGASKPFGIESTSFNADVQMLTRLAQVGGGRVLSAENLQREAFRREGLPPYSSLQDCSTKLLLLIILLFPLDVLIRRVMLDYGAIRKWLSRHRPVFSATIAVPQQSRTSQDTAFIRDNGSGNRDNAADISVRQTGVPSHDRNATDQENNKGSREESRSLYTERLLKAKKRTRHKR